LIKILRCERYKGGTRVTFVCGKRALDDYARKTIVLRESCRHLTVGEADLPETLVRWKEEKKKSARQLAQYRTAILQSEAKNLIQEAEQVGSWQVVKRSFVDRDAEEMKQLAKELMNVRSTIALIALKSGSGLVCFARSDDVDVDMGALLKDVFNRIGGRGGGQNVFAQGSCNESARADEALDLAADLIRSKLG
jgi:alanyl-tRNA synthetase